MGDAAGGASAGTDARSPRGRCAALGTPSPLESARLICAASGTPSPSVSGRFVRAALATPSPLASGSTLSSTPSQLASRTGWWPVNRRGSHQRYVLLLGQELQGEDGVQQAAFQGDGGRPVEVLQAAGLPEAGALKPQFNAPIGAVIDLVAEDDLQEGCIVQLLSAGFCGGRLLPGRGHGNWQERQPPMTA